MRVKLITDRGQKNHTSETDGSRRGLPSRKAESQAQRIVRSHFPLEYVPRPLALLTLPWLLCSVLDGYELHVSCALEGPDLLC